MRDIQSSFRFIIIIHFRRRSGIPQKTRPKAIHHFETGFFPAVPLKLRTPGARHLTGSDKPFAITGVPETGLTRPRRLDPFNSGAIDRKPVRYRLAAKRRFSENSRNFVLSIAVIALILPYRPQKRMNKI